ncbi:MAG: hypothetical protein ACJA1E_000919 [Paracoccaceae bacterium]|jgi:hypothetical protein
MIGVLAWGCQAVSLAVLGGASRIMDVVLHFGAHRTATRSLHQFMSQNQDTFPDVVLWSTPDLHRGRFNDLVRSPEKITLEVEARAWRRIGALRIAQQLFEQQGMRRLIVSSPDMLGPQRALLRSERLYGDISERARRFVAPFGARCATVVVAIRSYDSFWRSVLAQSVWSGGAFPKEAQLDRLVTQPYRWRRMIEQVAPLFPRAQLVVWPYEALGSLPEHQAGILCGRPVTRFRGGRESVGASPDRAALREVAVHSGNSGIACSDMLEGDGRWQPFSADHIKTLQAQYSEDLAWLRAGASGLATFVEGRASEPAAMLLTTG